MPRYFFPIRVRDRVFPDREGIELPTGTDPRTCALDLARKLRAEGEIGPGLTGCFVEVKDSEGSHIALIPIPEADEGLETE